MPGTSSKTLLNLTEEVLKDSQFEYERISDTDAYSIDYSFEDVSWMIFVQVVENLGLVIAYSVKFKRVLLLVPGKRASFHKGEQAKRSPQRDTRYGLSPAIPTRVRVLPALATRRQQSRCPG